MVYSPTPRKNIRKSSVNIDLSKVISEIDFNTADIQVYPGSKGKIELREAINAEYFGGYFRGSGIIN